MKHFSINNELNIDYLYCFLSLFFFIKIFDIVILLSKFMIKYEQTYLFLIMGKLK